jgi:hypothetical protein
MGSTLRSGGGSSVRRKVVSWFADTRIALKACSSNILIGTFAYGVPFHVKCPVIGDHFDASAKYGKYLSPSTTAAE